LIESVIIGAVVLMLNVLDSVTTSVCFRQYPDETLKGEGNPFMRWLMLKNRALAEVVKQCGVLTIVILAVVVWNDVATLKYLAIVLGLVVLNNTYIVVSRAITKRKGITPFEKLRGLIHFPKKYLFGLAITVILGLAWGIYQLIF